MDQRTQQLAQIIVNYSCTVQKGEKVFINMNGLEAMPLVKALIKEVYRVGALPFVKMGTNTITRELMLNASEEQLKLMATEESSMMKEMDAYVGIGSNLNSCELFDVPDEKIRMYDKLYSTPVLEVRLKKKWVVLRYPTNSNAEKAGMSFEGFEDFYYNVCNLDYKKMSSAMDNLKALMDNTDKVRIVAKDTDISFSIKGIPTVKCDGNMNLPDGEIYTAPVKDSVNGYITYNTPSEYLGFCYENVRLEFKDGKIINATANDTERINNVFDMDEGARYVGEFAIGVNPYILKPMKETLFDEKIMGSIHFTPGQSYDDAYNGNHSSVHWDLVLIQTKEYGGGEIYFDEKLVRKDGYFVLPELECLNPENLV